METQLNIEQAKEYIRNLDFKMIKFKLSHPTLGSNWTSEKVNRVALEYKNYLTMILTELKQSGQLMPPSHDLDVFWHAHILDTQAYVQDCASIFGRYLHHFPYFGMRNKQDEENLQVAFKDTKNRYKENFGETLG